MFFFVYTRCILRRDVLIIHLILQVSSPSSWLSVIHCITIREWNVAKSTFFFFFSFCNCCNFYVYFTLYTSMCTTTRRLSVWQWIEFLLYTRCGGYIFFVLCNFFFVSLLILTLVYYSPVAARRKKNEKKKSCKYTCSCSIIKNIAFVLKCCLIDNIPRRRWLNNVQESCKLEWIQGIEERRKKREEKRSQRSKQYIDSYISFWISRRKVT